MIAKPLSKYFLAALIISSFIISSAFFYPFGKVIQIDVSYLLNIRPVTTLTNGKLVVWTKGVDRENGYLTAAASVFNKEISSKAMPDNSLIAANKHHPPIKLHYDNKNGVSRQACLLADTGGMFNLKVPKNKYSDLYICLTSAHGSSKIKYELVYVDGSEVKNIIVPDWAFDVPDNDPDLSYVVHDLAKWSNRNTLTETDNHNIHALNVHPDAKRVLKAVKVTNLSKTYMLFWAATGVLK